MTFRKVLALNVREVSNATLKLSSQWAVLRTAESMLILYSSKLRLLLLFSQSTPTAAYHSGIVYQY